MISLGIDLAGSEKRKTGVCILKNSLEAYVKTVFLDKEIIDIALEYNPNVIAIDAPLTLPRDRVSLYEKGGSHLRECDRKLLKMGIKILPLTLGGMRKLTMRGIRLRNKFQKLGYRVIEVYPGAAQDILGLPRSKNIEGLRDGLKSIGIKNIENANRDELDAVTAAYIGYLFLLGRVFIVRGEDGEIVLPLV